MCCFIADPHNLQHRISFSVESEVEIEMYTVAIDTRL